MKKRFSVINLLVIAVLMVWTLFPVYWMVSLSIRDQGELRSSIPLLPRSFTTDHFIRLFRERGFLTATLNSLQVTLISVLISLVLGLGVAYVLSRVRLRIRTSGFLGFWIFMIRVLPPIAFAIPLYLMMTNAKLIQTKIPIISAHILINLTFIIWFMITFFKALPIEMEESAMLDGATEWQILTRIVMPLVMPGVASVSILSFMTSWNEYLYGVIFVQKPGNFTIPLVLATMNSEQELAEYGLIAAGGIISLLPVLLFVIFAQKYLISGLSSGAVKE